MQIPFSVRSSVDYAEYHRSGESASIAV